MPSTPYLPTSRARATSSSAPKESSSVGAKYEIYQLILDLANKNKVVMVVSSEMPELLGICDRILVMSGGRLAGEVNVSETNQEEIMTLAAKYV